MPVEKFVKLWAGFKLNVTVDSHIFGDEWSKANAKPSKRPAKLIVDEVFYTSGTGEEWRIVHPVNGNYTAQYPGRLAAMSRTYATIEECRADFRATIDIALQSVG